MATHLAPGTDTVASGLNPTLYKKFDLGYAYAPSGNLTGKTVYDPDTGTADDAWAYSYDNHAATAITTTRAGARFSMQYDAAGNMVRQADGEKNMAKTLAPGLNPGLGVESQQDSGGNPVPDTACAVNNSGCGAGLTCR